MLIDYFTTVLPVRNEINNLKYILPTLTKTVGELIVIDGHSIDGSYEFAKKYTEHVFQDNGLGKGQAIDKPLKLRASQLLYLLMQIFLIII